ncbi:MAG TPA: HEAT repeat domain-containing protein [Thermoanaerobaculia bacterium]|nr:HEAT repeat domain-containing protein [Thermoanaerobaculia bacterium]
MFRSGLLIAYVVLAVVQVLLAIAIAVTAWRRRSRIRRTAVMLAGRPPSASWTAIANAVSFQTEVAAGQKEVVPDFASDDSGRKQIREVLRSAFLEWEKSGGRNARTTVEGALLLLSRHPGPDDVHLFCRALFAPDKALRPFAAMCFGREPQTVGPAVVALTAAIREHEVIGLQTGVWALRRALSVSPDQILALETDPSPIVRLAAVRAATAVLDRLNDLGQLHQVEPYATMCRALLKDDDVRVRTSAVAALRAMRDEQSTQALVAALDDQSEYVRIAAAEALAWSGRETAILELAARLADASPRVRTHILNSLARWRAPVPPSLLTWLDEDDEVRAASALAAIGMLEPEPSTLRTLLAFAGNAQDDLKREACHAIARIARSAPALCRDHVHLSRIIELLESESDAIVVATLAEALGSAGSRDALQPLMGRIATVGRYERERIVEALALIEIAAAREDGDWTHGRLAETAVQWT